MSEKPLRQWASEICEEMEGWAHCPPVESIRGHTRIVHQQTGATLCMDVDMPENGRLVYRSLNAEEQVPEDARFEFYAEWPQASRPEHDYGYGVFKPDNAGTYEITCSAKRTPAAIAGDVQRRLIDKGYLAAYVEQTARLERAVEHRAAVLQVANDLARAAKAKDSENNRAMMAAHSPTVAAYTGGRRCEYRVDSPTSVHILLRGVSPATALRIIELINEDNADPTAARS